MGDAFASLMEGSRWEVMNSITAIPIMALLAAPDLEVESSKSRTMVVIGKRVEMSDQGPNTSWYPAEGMNALTISLR